MIRLGLSCFPAILSPISMYMSNKVNKNFRAVRPHHRADKYIIRDKITTSLSYMGPNVKKFAFLAIQEGLIPRYPLTYINLLHYKIWKQSDKDFLSYSENDEISADVAAADAA